MIIKIEDGVAVGNPILEENFKQLFPDTSFPRYLTAETVEPFGYGMYEFSQVPKPGKHQKVVEGAPKKDAQGVWRQTWNVVAMDDTEKAAEDEKQKNLVRMERSRKLYASDWTQLADASLTEEKKQAWAAYRQALRDVPLQQGFPYDITWPTQP